MAWPPSCFVSDSTDAEGRFWWRGSLHVGRRTFWSLRKRDQIVSFPLFQTLMLVEGAVMLGGIYGARPGEWAAMYLEVPLPRPPPTPLLFYRDFPIYASRCETLFKLWCRWSPSSWFYGASLA